MGKEICRQEEIRQIYDKLVNLEDPYSYPVRGMLSLIMSKKINQSKVYVDEWPQFNSVACLQISLEYSEFDFDTVTVYSKDSTHFKQFFGFLNVERKWQRRGFHIMYLKNDFVEFSKTLMPHMSVNDFGPFLLFEQPPDKEIMQSYRTMPLELLEKLLPGAKLGPVCNKDVQGIVDAYHVPVPGRVEMFRWMALNLPSSALKDVQGRLIAWCLTYACGIAGALYVIPEYRRSGISGFVGLDVLNKLCHLCPGIRYEPVTPDNTASINLNLKFGGKNTRAVVKWVVFTPCKKSKL